MEFATAYERHVREGIEFDQAEGRTHQSFKDECDINEVMRRWERGQAPTLIARGNPLYGDFTNADDYLSAMETVRLAQESFAALPARLRARCLNDPAEFIRFASDEANRDELRALGVLQEAKPTGPAEPAATTPPTPPESPGASSPETVAP